MKKYRPDVVFYQPEVTMLPFGRSVLSACKQLGAEAFSYTRKKHDPNWERHLGSPEKQNGDTCFGKHIAKAKKQVLCLKHNMKDLVDEENFKDGVVAMAVYKDRGYKVLNLKLGSMCVFMCHYCYLNAVYKFNPETAVYTNTSQMQTDMNAALKQHGRVLFNSGEHTDSLALDWLTGHTKWLVPWIGAREGALLELRTKSAEIDNLIGLEHNGRTVVAFSLAPEFARKHFESNSTASLEERIAAIIRLAKNGYKIALKIDPVIIYDGWREDYEKMLDRLSSEWAGAGLSTDLIDHYAVGTLRYSGGLKRVIQDLAPASRVLEHEDHFIMQKGKATYPDNWRAQLYKRIIGYVEERFGELPYYLSMESADKLEELMA